MMKRTELTVVITILAVTGALSFLIGRSTVAPEIENELIENVDPDVIPEPVQDPLPIVSEDREEIQPDVLLRETVLEYFEAWEDGDRAKMLSFYVNSSETVFEWNGGPWIWGASYPGYGKVREFIDAFRPMIIEMDIVLSNYTAAFDGNKAIVTGTLYATAEGKMVGKFFMSVDIETEWEHTEEGWKMTRDTWGSARVAAERTITHAFP